MPSKILLFYVFYPIGGISPSIEGLFYANHDLGGIFKSIFRLDAQLHPLTNMDESQ